MERISMPDANDFVVSVVLEGETYKLHFSFNVDVGHWFMDLRDRQSNDIVRGISVVPNFPLLRQYQRHTQIRGELVASSVMDDVQTIGRDGFTSGKFTFVYVPEDEVNAIMEADISA